MTVKALALFPLDGSRGLGRDVVDDPVHAVDLVDDAVRDAREERVGQANPVGGHAVTACRASRPLAVQAQQNTVSAPLAVYRVPRRHEAITSTVMSFSTKVFNDQAQNNRKAIVSFVPS